MLAKNDPNSDCALLRQLGAKKVQLSISPQLKIEASNMPKLRRRGVNHTILPSRSVFLPDPGNAIVSIHPDNYAYMVPYSAGLISWILGDDQISESCPRKPDQIWIQAHSRKAVRLKPISVHNRRIATYPWRKCPGNKCLGVCEAVVVTWVHVLRQDIDLQANRFSRPVCLGVIQALDRAWRDGLFG